MKMKVMLETVWNQVQCHLTSKSLTEVDQLTERRSRMLILVILFYNPINIMIKLAPTRWSI